MSGEIADEEALADGTEEERLTHQTASNDCLNCKPNHEHNLWCSKHQLNHGQKYKSCNPPSKDQPQKLTDVIAPLMLAKMEAQHGIDSASQPVTNADDNASGASKTPEGERLPQEEVDRRIEEYKKEKREKQIKPDQSIEDILNEILTVRLNDKPNSVSWEDWQKYEKGRLIVRIQTLIDQAVVEELYSLRQIVNGGGSPDFLAQHLERRIQSLEGQSQ